MGEKTNNGTRSESAKSLNELKYYGLKVGLAQINPIVGDLPGNRDKIIHYIEEGEKNNCDIIIFPELAITGYPIQDLIFINGFVEDNLKVIEQIKSKVTKSMVVVGCITRIPKTDYVNTTLTPFYNSAAIIRPNEDTEFVHKHLLPNYDVFDEKRYFCPSEDFRIIDFRNLKVGVEICEDLWDEQYSTKVTKNLRNLGANIIININASPFYIEKPVLREEIIKNHVNKEKIPLVYLNIVGGQDEITFDGRSVVFDSNGRAIKRLPSFKEVFSVVNVPVPIKNTQELPDGREVDPNAPEFGHIPLEYVEEEEIYKALSLNLRDYFNKVGIFKEIVLGLSGGIDSSLTAAVACNAVGPDKVIGILMPSKFSSDHSVNDAVQLCKNLGMRYKTVPIKTIHQAFDKQVKEAFDVSTFDLADENLQARIRGVILMYYSNKFNALLLSTGNKSEIATGYCTLYGDTNGGKNAIGDLYKMQVYKVSRWINKNSIEKGGGVIIPQNSIDKPPSAELRENQTDQDSLPPYDLLDSILVEFIENDKSIEEIIAMGYDADVVNRVEKLYYAAEFKRAQLVQTIKITKKGFGIGRRIPVINKYPFGGRNL